MMVLVSPILTRIYSIGDFAVWAIFLAISGQISVIACLRFEAALVIVKGDKNIGGILKGAIIINTMICVFTFIAILFLEPLYKPILFKRGLHELFPLLRWVKEIIN